MDELEGVFEGDPRWIACYCRALIDAATGKAQSGCLAAMSTPRAWAKGREKDYANCNHCCGGGGTRCTRRRWDGQRSDRPSERRGLLLQPRRASHGARGERCDVQLRLGMGQQRDCLELRASSNDDGVTQRKRRRQRELLVGSTCPLPDDERLDCSLVLVGGNACERWRSLGDDVAGQRLAKAPRRESECW